MGLENYICIGFYLFVVFVILIDDMYSIYLVFKY